MGTSILGIGISGLNAAQAGLSTTSHNIGNANTPHFSRQSTLQSTPPPQFTGAGFLGNGTVVGTVRRSYSEFLEAQMREAATQASHLDTFHTQISQVDNLLLDPQAGLTPAMNEFFAGLNAVSSSPDDPAARQVFLSNAQTLAGRFRDLASRLDSLRTGANEEIGGAVSSLNAQASQIAQLNDKIRTALGNGQPPNDLLDQRDALLRDLAGTIRINVTPLADGTLNAFLPNGQSLVLSTQSFALSTGVDPGNPHNVAIGLGAGSAFKPLRESDLAGGTLGGLLAFRNQALDGIENALGRIAATFADSLNAQHAMGQDRAGAPGGALFSTGGPAVFSNANNTGNAVLGATISNAGALDTSDYRLRYDGANYTLTKLADNTTQTFATLPQTVAGVTIALAAGSAAAGDNFLIQPVHNAASNFTALVTSTTQVAAANAVRTSAAAANTGSITARVAAVTPPMTANLTQPVSITFTSPATFDISGTGTGNPTGLTFTSGMTISYNGWSVKLSGAAAAGDVFSVGVNTGATGDNGNALALAAVQSSRVIGGGGATLNEAYAQMVGTVGSMTHAADIDSRAQATVLTQATAAQQSVSGVNLDEEAANLLRYQQAYQAAGKVIATANSLFDEILNIMR